VPIKIHRNVTAQVTDSLWSHTRRVTFRS
jgi:hypothetical protein